jgi:hypothetical protein
VEAGRLIDVLDGLGDQLNLFSERLALLAVHLVFISEVDHEDLACLHCVFDLLAFLFPLLMQFFLVLLDLLFGHRLHVFLLTSLLSHSALLVALFLEFRVINIPYNFLYFFASPLRFSLVILSFFPLIEHELIHSLFEDIEKGIVRDFFVGLLHQLYNKLISFIKRPM